MKMWFIFSILALLSCHSPKEAVETVTTDKTDLSDSAQISDELIVILDQGEKIGDLISAFQQYNLGIKYEIGRGHNMWLLQYDLEKINPNQIFKELENHPAVKAIQFNKQLQER